MPPRLVPAVVVVVLLALQPVAALPAGTAGAGASEPAPLPAPSPAANDTATVAGAGAIIDAAGAPDGATYLAGATGIRTANLTLTRLAPDGTVRWQRRYGTATDSRVPAAVASGSGPGAYVLERVGPPGAPAGPDARPTARLVRVAPGGSVMWTRSLGNATRFPGRTGGLLASPDGGVILARPTDADPAGTRLLRVTDDGDVAWSRSYDGGAPRALARDGDGGYLVAGQDPLGAAWLLGVDASGDVEFSRTYGSHHDREVVGVVPTDGGALLAGSAEARDFGFGDPWVARVDADGRLRWSRTYPTPDRASPQAAVATDAGVLVVHRTRADDGGRASRLTHVSADGAAGARSLSSPATVTAPVSADDGSVRLYGYTFDRETRVPTGNVTTVAVPAPSAAAPDPHAGMTSNATFYRGQNLRVRGAPNGSYDLYRLPTEYTEFDEPTPVRRIVPGADGEAVVETATLPRGSYVLRAGFGIALRLDDGRRVDTTTNLTAAAFELDEQDVRRPEPARTVVETYEGEREVRVRVESDPEAFLARVGLSRVNGPSIGPDTVRSALAADPQSGGTTGVVTEGGRAYGTVRIGADRNVTLDASALPAGLYRLSVTGVETADATEPATTRFVVIHEERPVSLTPANRTLTVSRDGAASTALRLSGADAGLGAIRLAANQTGPPPVELHLRLGDAIETGSVSAGAGIGRNRASAETTTTDVRSAPNGTFVAGRLTVEEADFGRPGGTSGPAPNRTTVTVGLAWLVDANGVPYSVPEGATVTVRFRNATGTASGRTPPDGGGSGSGGTSGSGGSGGAVGSGHA